MTNNSIDITCAQETHISQNSKEKKKDYTWYLNGNEQGEREFAGMAVIIRNHMSKFVTDIIPHSSRIVEIKLAGTSPISILAVYAPQSGRPQEEKSNFYELLHKLIQGINKGGPWLVMGDWNAKIQEADNEEEEKWIGPYTFGKGEETTWEQSEEVENNREHLLELCRKFELLLCNTLFHKHPSKLITWKTMGAKAEDPLDRQHYDQIDFILIPKRWRNGIMDAESDLTANIDSDHAPVWVKCKFKF